MKSILPLLLFICINGFAQTIDLTAYNEFLKDHVSSKGIVDFDKVLKNVDELNKITHYFSKISPNSGWSKSEKKAYWINFYNANIIKLLVEHYPIKSINYVQNAFSIKVIDYAGGKVSLDDIEHEILRKLEDPRIHFALYSTAMSSPVLKRTAYKPESVERDLGLATSNFLNDLTKNKIGSSLSKLSKTFQWYKDDFANLNEMISFINKHSGGAKINAKTKIVYMDYDWNLHRKI
ncbi:DUF547 domain-containing protein [Flavivirga spongiicola]|uniref:DUF547 domain-containing protein n=1 Tax=Flavivirga spongiicola TaxID=421621 RepID=A0ABU7XY46_9FLAO|nr:DUF547 domain-containing protein [Flavivirga sp. MEBiC05379]MDO5980708.1 DUF547 domain-containing protein [Flavivirga sp. MEBiC05379]